MSARAYGTTSSYGRAPPAVSRSALDSVTPAALVGEQPQQRPERLLLKPGAGVDPGHVVDDERARQAVEHLGVGGQVAGVAVTHKVPAPLRADVRDNEIVWLYTRGSHGDGDRRPPGL